MGEEDLTSYKPEISKRGLNSAFGELAEDPAGNTWVGDNYNDRTVEFKPPFSNGMNAFLLVGQKDFVTTTSSSRNDFFGCPSIYVD